MLAGNPVQLSHDVFLVLLPKGRRRRFSAFGPLLQYIHVGVGQQGLGSARRGNYCLFRASPIIAVKVCEESTGKGIGHPDVVAVVVVVAAAFWDAETQRWWHQKTPLSLFKVDVFTKIVLDFVSKLLRLRVTKTDGSNPTFPLQIDQVLENFQSGIIGRN